LRRVPRASAFFAMLYLAAIPAFGVYYAHHDDGFRATGLDQAALSHRAELEDLVSHGLNAMNPTKAALTPEGARITDVAGIRIYFAISLASLYRRGSFEIRCFLTGSFFYREKSPKYFVIECPDSPTLRKFHTSAEELFVRPFNAGLVSGQGMLSLPESAWMLHDRIVDENSGSIGSGTTGFARMTYFSTMTITTVGYGDIVPLSQSMRTAAAIEAVYGIGMVGLFLNSLALRAATGRRGEVHKS
jgi:hypothetical protein